MQVSDRQGVGRYGLEFTRMGLGGTAFGNMYTALDDEIAVELAEFAFNAGVRYFDTAPLYGYGLSESRLGAGLARLERDAFVISTKVGYTLVPRDPDEPFDSLFADIPPLKSVFDYSRDAVLRSVESSLKRLQTDRIDILLIHDPDEGVTLKPGGDPRAVSHFKEVMEQTYPALDELRSQRVIGAVGLGMNQWQMLRDFAHAGDFDCFLLAGRYTLLEQEPLGEFLPLCTEKNIRIIIGGPFNSGILATGAVEGAHYDYAPAPPEILERTRRIEQVCARHDVPLQAAALQFPFGHPTVATTIPGARSPAELEANIAHLERPIPGAFWEELKGESLIDPASPIPDAEE